MKKIADPIAAQSFEFDAVREFTKATEALFRTPIVDDDYPEMRSRYEGALYRMLSAMSGNGRMEARAKPIGLSFATLREANRARLPLFKNAQGGPAHSQPDGSDWSVSDWFVATLGELGEAANQHKKMIRNDFPPTQWEAMHQALAYELADVAIYLDILAFRIGVNLGEIIAEKWNKTSEKIGVPLRIEHDCDMWLDTAEG